MSAHTPGPWSADPKAVEDSYFEDVNVLRHDGLAIAVAVHNGDLGPTEVEKNAQLIAASPDLLAALVLFQKQWDACGPNSDFGRYFSNTIKAARAAITKATASQDTTEGRR